MPIQYSKGIIEEHKFTRSHSGIFDVSHMGQLFIYGDESLTEELEKIFPLDLKNLKLTQMVKVNLDELLEDHPGDLTKLIDNIRMIKSNHELNIARHAGEVGMAMMEAAKKQLAIMFLSMRLHLHNHKLEQEKLQIF